MLSHYALTSKLPLSYWLYAISKTTRIINRLPTPMLHNKFPWELLFHSRPDLHHLRTFGYTYFPLLRPYNIHKLQPHTNPCIFLGYPAYFKGDICLVLTSLQIYISKHVLFNEIEFFSFDSTSLPTGSSTGPFASSPSPISHWLSFLYHLQSPKTSPSQPPNQSHPSASISNPTPNPTIEPIPTSTITKPRLDSTELSSIPTTPRPSFV